MTAPLDVVQSWFEAQQAPDPLPEVRVLSLTQPWAALCANGSKGIETRSWGTPYRGWVAIHAAKGFPKPAQAFAHELVAEGHIEGTLAFGSILCVVWLVDVVPTEFAATIISDHERRMGDYTPGRKAWLFDQRRRVTLPAPITHVGAQGLRRLPDSVVAQLPRLAA